jgi:hypothetical protein
MAADLFFRTEDLQLNEVLNYLVETNADRSIIDSLKGRSPVIVKGSRGVGKSFLMRAAEAELRAEFQEKRILPVYVTFASASLIKADSPERFLSWMIAKICNRIVRVATELGLTLPAESSIISIQGGSSPIKPSKMEQVEKAYEESWKGKATAPDSSMVPDPEVLKDAAEDLCTSAGLRRIILFVDEAAHVFIPAQQRQFFTLMRDLRSPYLTVKAAVYPGATSYGHAFQPVHDATILSVDRSVTDSDYADNMRQIVFKQESSLKQTIERNGEVFDTLAYAATGNPRILLKTVARTVPFNRRNAESVLRKYYREEIWSEHSGLAERYPGHRELVDWGRAFIEGRVLPDLHGRNRGRRSETSAYFWMHRDAPQAIREALRLLSYSGVILEGDSGIRATRSEVGTRYMVNLGCLFAQDAEPIGSGIKVRKSLSIKRMVEYGANHPEYRPLDALSLDNIDMSGNEALESQLARPSSLLDVTDFQRSKLEELKLATIGAVLNADESVFKRAHYVGDIRARQMRNAAVAAVLEYLSG